MAKPFHLLARTVYYIALPFIYLLSILPFPVLYLLSDGLFVLLYYILRYRRGVVRQNLRNAFPDKNEAQITALERAFFRYLCDLLLETFKTLTISPSAMLKRCRLDAAAQELFNSLADQNKSFIIVMGHKGNWEWAGNTFSLSCRHHLYVIYHPLSNPHFDRLMYTMRTRFGTGLIAMKDTFREMLKNRKELSATAFIADQSPPPDKAWWMEFLHQDTPVFPGVEKLAEKMSYPVVYVRMERQKRGSYQVYAHLLADPPYAFDPGVITEMHMRQLEIDIRQQPETWLWSHRRWKHKRTL